MGMFDRIVINGEEIQTKAFGKNLKTYSLGDEVKIEPEIGWHNDWKNVDYETYQVEGLGNHSRDVFIDVEKSYIVGFSLNRNPSVPLFDYDGFIVETKNSSKITE